MKKYIFGLVFVVGLVFINPLSAKAAILPTNPIVPSLAPTISYIDPTSVVPGGSVFVHGINFNANTYVAFDGTVTIWPSSGIKGVVGDENFSFIVPSSASMGNHTVQVGEKGSSYPLSSSVWLSVTIPRPIAPLDIMANGILPGGTVGVYYNSALQAQYGILPYFWSALFLNGITLPAGLAISTNSKGEGVLSGTPTTAGTYTFTITVTDAMGTIATKSYTVKIASSSNTTNPSVKVLSPNGGETYNPGQQITVKWQTGGYGSVTPLIGFDLATCTTTGGNCSNTYLISFYNLPDTGSKAITIPSNTPSASNYKIRLYSYDASYNSIYNKTDYSNSVFTIKSGTPPSGTTNPVNPSGVYGSAPTSTVGSSTYGSQAPSGVLFTQTVSYGMRNDIVLKLQNELIKRGLLAADFNTGFFGNGTKASLCKFQVSKGLIEATDFYCGYNLGVKSRAAFNSQ